MLHKKMNNIRIESDNAQHVNIRKNSAAYAQREVTLQAGMVNAEIPKRHVKLPRKEMNTQ